VSPCRSAGSPGKLCRVDTLTVWTAQYLLWIMVVVFGAVWLFVESRTGKINLAVTAIIGLILALVLLYVAKDVHSDPRPFVQNPHIKPLFGHSTDNGFPSDHSVAAALIAVLVLARRRIVGAVLALAATAIAWARVAAHVHHLQDVLAGLALGALAAAIAVAVAAPLIALATRRLGARSSR
jgi:membrane-associated phospholipid phosphatase